MGGGPFYTFTPPSYPEGSRDSADPHGDAGTGPVNRVMTPTREPRIRGPSGTLPGDSSGSPPPGEGRP